MNSVLEMKIQIAKMNILFKTFGNKWFVKLQCEQGIIQGSVASVVVEVNSILMSVIHFQKFVHSMMNGESIEVNVAEVAASETDQKFNGGAKTKLIFVQ